MRNRALSPTFIALLALAVLTWPWAGAVADPFGECEASFKDGPQDRRSASCFYEQARLKPGLWDGAEHRLNRHLSDHPQYPWLYYYLGHVVLIRENAERAEGLYREAVAIFHDLGESAHEIEALIALSRCLAHLRQYEKAAEVLERALGIAESTREPSQLASVRIRQAFQYLYQFENLDYAYHLLQLVKEDVFAGEREDLKMLWLAAAARVSSALGRYEEARASKKLLLAMAVEAGDLTTEAQVRYDIAVDVIMAELPSESASQEARSLFEEALASARNAGHPSVEGQAHLELGKLLGGVQGREHFISCLGIAEDRDDPVLLKDCREALAANLLQEDPGKAQGLIEQVLAAALESPDPWLIFYGWENRWPIQWATLPRTEAVGRSLNLLDGIEGLRELQGSGPGRAGLISFWSGPYYWLAGRLLEGTGEGAPARRAADREDLELAFRVIERMRARVLLEALETARAAPPPPTADTLLRQLSEILERKVQIQRRLLDPRLDQLARSEAVAELRPLESSEAELRHRIAQTYPSYAALREPALADLGDIEESLSKNEALLSYQIGLDEDFYGRFAGGAWLLVSSRGGTQYYRLPDRVALEPALDVLLGTPDLDKAAAGLKRFHDDLLRQALADLPAGVDRLVIIPDGKLHRLPFALLRPAVDAEPLIARYQLSVVPSATLWRRWRSLDPPTSEVPALALAAPVLLDQATEPAEPGTGERQWALEEGARLEQLPYAREEGRDVVRILGGESRLLMGADATERFLKENDLRRYGVLHFAAHAVLNDEVPERSAVLLAPGADDEDGWLQPQDIVELDLEGRAVVLASCDTAAGQVLRGEGPMSLARAFFQAGAPVVVASLWPLQDEETAALSREFYCRLAAGASVAEALATAQRKMLRRGAPARAWAGLVVLGNGDLVPFPGGLDGSWACRPWRTYAVLAVPVLAALLLFVIRRRRG